MSTFIVYALLCPKCMCPRYVGQTSEFEERMKNHMKGMACTDASIYKKHWVQSLLNQGLEPVVKVLLDLPTAEHLDAAEIYWIAEMKRRGCPLTNLTDGGGGLRGYKASPETIEKRVSHFRGVPKTEECKAKLSAALIGRPSPKKGQSLTPEQKAAHQLSHSIPPFQDQNGRVYSSIKEACEANGVSEGNVCNVLKRKRPSTGGLVFTYLHELDEMADLDRKRLAAKAKSKEETRLRNRERTRLWKLAHPDYMRNYMKTYTK